MFNKLENRQLLGVFFVSMGVLTLEIALTRIFSVTLWYHFAFLAISLSLMSSASAGVALYFFPGLGRPENVHRWIGWLSIGMALSIPITFIIYRQVPFAVVLNTGQSFTWRQLLWLLVIYVDLAIPFFLSGAMLSLALTAWAGRAGRMYWADLIGASVGCLFSIVALEWLGGAGALLAAGGLVALAGIVFTWNVEWLPGRKRLSKAFPFIVFMGMIGLSLGAASGGWFPITSTKGGGAEPPRVYERWNAHSRVSVYEPVNYPFYWSVDEQYWERAIAEGGTFRHALLLIDAVAGTPIQGYDGALNQVNFLRYDLTAFVYHVIEAPNTLVIGSGGGRDVLAALTSGAPHVTAVEVNPAVIEAVRGPFGEFSGHLYDLPEVTVAVADARGYIARSPNRYDVIQASLIDTWAAGGSGAFALSENSLYTTEAFQTYYEHLTDRGIMTVSRWYQPEHPAETMRLVSTGMAGWERAGVSDPRQHVVVVARTTSGAATEGLATALFKRAPFTSNELLHIREQAETLGFTVLYLPGSPITEEVGEFITAPDHAAFVAAYPLDVSPATDDRPFFFNLIRLGDLLDASLNRSGVYRMSLEAVYMLSAVIGVALFFGVLFVILPLLLSNRRNAQLTRPSFSLLGYFALLGIAFMLMEIPTIQKFTVYLGRPVYSLAVALFSILLFSSLGSLWSSRWAATSLTRNLRWVFPLLAFCILLHAATALWPLPQTQNLPLAARLLVTLLLLAPPSFLMGIPFPSGIRWMSAQRRGAVPWIWSINGVMSMLGSALATALAIQIGFRATLVIAAVLYALAGILLLYEIRHTSA